ncbi:helix-turn-helix domain-containing protein [Lactiplantibacillus plantarum]|uniref:helix-turn-helix domain-containing protein n=1 Tax=Lactiplantibacillus plantarum TaxID=1590 RepID=UPI002001D553|nr:helix-turn-helix transcriptional regulator [Lactiplantibacillus plantarum]
MNLADKIKTIADKENITIAELERRVGISNGQIRKWNTRSPQADNLNKIAKYFGVSMDYLLGNIAQRSDDSILLQNTHDVGTLIDLILTDLHSNTQTNFHGHPLTDTDKTKLSVALTAALHAAQIDTSKKEN